MKIKNKRFFKFISSFALFVFFNTNNDISFADSFNRDYPSLSDVSFLIMTTELKKEVTPSGYTLEEIQYIINHVYEKGVNPLIIDGIIIANKNYSLPSNLSEVDIANEANEAFNSMKDDSELYLNAFSVYRSYDRQSNLYSRYSSLNGRKEADTYSARPGKSEHQTGLGFDIGGNDSSKYASSKFHNTSESVWLKNNAYKYGFTLRYPKGKEHITGYMYESWHYRYLGEDISRILHEKDITLEEYFGLDKISSFNNFTYIK